MEENTVKDWMVEVSLVLTPWHWEMRWENGSWWKTFQVGPLRLVMIDG
jgi:hypothetical protein